MIRNHFLYFLFLPLIIIFILSFSSCRSSDEEVIPKVEVGKGFLTFLPVDTNDFDFFVNLGHLNQPGHTFPSGHGGFVLTDHLNTVPVYSPADMMITNVTFFEHVTEGFTDYTLTLSVNQGEFQIVIGHMSSIHEDILEKAGQINDDECEEYTLAGNHYRSCCAWTEIPVKAGDILGTGGGNEGQFGIDFGTFDKSRKMDLATDRFDDYLYSCAVSPLDYYTDSISQILIPICGDALCHGEFTTRTKPPVGGTIDYSIRGSAQGIWFKEGEQFSQEDQHMALIYHNVDPDLPVFSMSMGLADIDPGSYTFSPENSGFVDRWFYDVKSDGNIYRYYVWYHCSRPAFGHAVILLQLIDDSHLKVEIQDSLSGPPWQFTSNATMYDR